MEGIFTNPDRRRRHPRLNAELAAQFETLSGILHLSVLDLSQSGARLRPHSNVSVGTQGVLTWLDFEAFGEVVWHADGLVGIEFDRPLRPAVIFQTRRAIEAGEALNEDQLSQRRAKEWFENFR